MESALNLTDEQKKQMAQIWSEMARGGGRHEMWRRQQQLRDERDKAILALVKPEDKPASDAIMQSYRDQQQAQEREMRGNFEKAVEATKRILTAEQREKYDDLLSRHRPPDRGARGHGPASRPSPQPSSKPFEP